MDQFVSGGEKKKETDKRSKSSSLGGLGRKKGKNGENQTQRSKFLRAVHDETSQGRGRRRPDGGGEGGGKNDAGGIPGKVILPD